MNKIYNLIVTKEEDGIRIDKYIALKLENMSRMMI